MSHKSILIAVVIWLGAVGAVTAQLQHPSLLRNHPAIGYATAPTRDAIAELNRKLKAGEVTLKAEGPSGYLRSVLDALNIPVESQLLVFSKTSFQASRIGPKNPRAIYFNDTVSVGWVRGGEVLEFAAQDPAQGTLFYTLSQDALSQNQRGAPLFERNDMCVGCHSSSATHYVPGMFIGSVFPGVDGTLLYAGPAETTDHRTPFDLRWGGWFVTG